MPVSSPKHVWILLLIGGLFLTTIAFVVFAFIAQWEGPLDVALIASEPPTFKVSGLSTICGISIYGPGHQQAEWMGDHIGLLWDAERTTQHCPYSAQFTYGSAPANFEVAFPRSGSPVSVLNSEIEYWVVVGRGQGGPEDYSLKDSKLSSGRPQWLSGMCWGDLKVPERTNPAWVRVDCKTNRPLEMTSRGMARLNLYREKKIVFY